MEKMEMPLETTHTGKGKDNGGISPPTQSAAIATSSTRVNNSKIIPAVQVIMEENCDCLLSTIRKAEHLLEDMDEADIQNDQEQEIWDEHVTKTMPKLLSSLRNTVNDVKYQRESWMAALPLELTPKNAHLTRAFTEFKFNGSSIQDLLLRARSAFERLKEQISPEDDEAMVSEMFRLDPEGKPNASSTPYNEFNHSLSRKFPGRQDEASSFGSLDHSANDLFRHPGDKHMASTTY